MSSKEEGGASILGKGRQHPEGSGSRDQGVFEQ